MLKLLYAFSIFIFIDTFIPTNDLIKNNLKGKVKTIEYSSKEESAIYNYNKDGYLISKINFPHNDSSIILNNEKRTYKYYANRKIKEIEIISYKNNSNLIIEGRHVEKYDTSGDMIRDTYYLTGFGDNYNGEGVRQFDPYKDIETIHKCTYNNITKEKTCHEYLAGDTYSSYWMTKYDSEENAISYLMVIGKETAF